MVEALIVLGILTVLATGAVVLIQPSLRRARSDAGVAYVTNQIRNARQRAIAERRVYELDFVAPRTMNLQQGNNVNGNLTFTASGSLDLPAVMQFQLPSTRPATPPDGFGNQTNVIDFSVTGGGGGGTSLYFQPDGTVMDAQNGLTNGVVYVSQNGDADTSRAVSLFGATGRAKAWRVSQTANGPQWVQE
jgi:Tfp pilus assembly protein FimT